MSAYRVTLLDCDLCGQVLDMGPQAVEQPKARVRALSRAHGWRSWRSTDLCPSHDDLTMPQALDAADARFATHSTDQDQQNRSE